VGGGRVEQVILQNVQHGGQANFQRVLGLLEHLTPDQPDRTFREAEKVNLKIPKLTEKPEDPVGELAMENHGHTDDQLDDLGPEDGHRREVDLGHVPDLNKCTIWKKSHN